MTKDDDLRADLSLACRVLAHNGHEHLGLGHVSARVPGGVTLLVKPSGLALSDVEPDDIVACDLDGRKLSPGRSLHSEMPIHTEIYRLRPDVNSVVHTHPPFTAAFSASDGRLAMVSQDSIWFAAGVGTYNSAELVTSPARGRNVARVLRDGRAVILRNHGLATAEGSLYAAVVLAVALEESLRTQHRATGFGEIRRIPPEQVAAMRAAFERSYSARMLSAWRVLVGQLESSHRVSST